MPSDEMERDELARNAAHEIATLFQTVLSAVFPGHREEPLTLANLLGLGAFMVKTVSSLPSDVGLGAMDEELLEHVFNSINDPEALEKLIYQRIKSGAEDAEELKNTIQKVGDFVSRPPAFRSVLINVIKESFPPTPPGRKPDLKVGDEITIAKTSDQLIPVIQHVWYVHQRQTRRSIPETIEFSSTDHPEGVKFLKEYVTDFTRLLRDTDYLSQAKTPEGKVRLLADSIAGRQFGISFSYSLQKARQGRRTIRKQLQ